MGENELQGAVSDALATYMHGRGIRYMQLAPYANQQGDGLQRYCADLVGVAGASFMILLEMKVLDCSRRQLKKFSEVQFRGNLRFEHMGVPVAYAYNNTDALAYHDPRRDGAWPERTLEQVNRSAPSLLPGVQPAIEDHETLLSWLERAANSDEQAGSVEMLGRIFGAVRTPAVARNGVLALVYGVSSKKLFALSSADLLRIRNVLTKPHALLSVHQREISAILGQDAAVFRQFRARPPAQRSPGMGR